MENERLEQAMGDVDLSITLTIGDERLLVAEIRRLRERNEKLESGYRAGRDAERKAVVEWLREAAKSIDVAATVGRKEPRQRAELIAEHHRWLADGIARGDHDKEAT